MLNTNDILIPYIYYYTTQTKSLPLVTATTKATKPAAVAQTSTRKLRSHSTKEASATSAKASPAKASSVKPAESGKNTRKPAPGMKFNGNGTQEIVDFSEEEIKIIQKEVAAGTTQKKIAEMLSEGKEYTRTKIQVNGQIKKLGLAKKTEKKSVSYRPDTKQGRKVIALFHSIKAKEAEGFNVDLPRTCRHNGFKVPTSTDKKGCSEYWRLQSWLNGKEEPPKPLSNKKSAISNRKSSAKKRKAVEEAADEEHEFGDESLFR